MADNHSKEVRSINMSHIRSTNSKPEEIVRKYLFAEGFRYRKNVKKLPGCPDIVLPKYKAVIFVNGCFWHKHDCPRFVWPSSNQDYWRPKILRNVERDNQSRKELETLGWKVITVWECELKKNVLNETLGKLIAELKAIAVNPVFREEVQRPCRLFEIVDFRPMLIAPPFLRLDAVLNVDNKGDTAALLLRGFGGAGAPALDALRYGFLCIIRAESFQTGKAFLPRCAARYVFTGLYLIARSLQQPQKIGKV